MNLLEGQSTARRAELLGLPLREYYAINRRDPRILDPRATAELGGFERLRAWIAAGQPAPDLDAFEYAGDLAIERTCRRLLVKLPASAAHHVVERVLTVGVGVDSGGWCMARPPELPTPSDDRPHLVAVSAARETLVAHEWAHSWFATMSPWSRERTPQREELMHYRRACAELVTADVTAAPDGSDRLAELAAESERHERRTDALAALFCGRPVDHCGPDRANLEAARIVAEASMKNPA